MINAFYSEIGKGPGYYLSDAKKNTEISRLPSQSVNLIRVTSAAFAGCNSNSYDNHESGCAEEYCYFLYMLAIVFNDRKTKYLGIS